MKKYKVGVGVWKSIKNTLVIWGIPAALLLLDNWTQWIPEDKQAVAIPIMGLIAYFVKNYVQNK